MGLLVQFLDLNSLEDLWANISDAISEANRKKRRGVVERSQVNLG